MSGYAGTIVWEDPPTVRNPSGHPAYCKWPRMLAPLHAHPGRWARVWDSTSHDGARTVAKRLRTGDYVGIREGEYETVVRGVAVYARYLAPCRREHDPSNGGPYCRPCSDRAQAWVPWPCPRVGVRP